MGVEGAKPPALLAPGYGGMVVGAGFGRFGGDGWIIIMFILI